MVDENTIIEALRKVYDPEIPVNLVDLGLIYSTSIENGSVNIKMTLTATACPMHTVISQNVKVAVEALEGVSEAVVDIVWEPRWNPEMISPVGRIALGME
ncbi:MAG: DUF59 domain-containing protein [Candidatus Marinimicrobia bacterium]|nr:DUF59 domain-containing protein [Candidatus Neomarinimicrobiota bacterium]MBT4360463.1 DUF59 domain-containing protein [Candidatus Neomarinimicrobiota bacterium]MBT4714723.1 DUF59 domain-containing protein [Candidatus Neomarinimicrobiota bacterium]MBT4944941.1 DUF59 domain-containing protein [Candidatus Neomarinimicrobiota bacterium]MBT5270530.1 DUF59 domain-containing protein [Candidatus Neomarinimicrobiota bacterium]